MRGVTFRCPDDHEVMKIESVVMGEEDYLKYIKRIKEAHAEVRPEGR